MAGQDTYKHLNDGGDGAVIGIEQIAEQVERLNYGTHRLLSAIVRVRLARRPSDSLGLALKELLDRGLY